MIRKWDTRGLQDIREVSIIMRYDDTEYGIRWYGVWDMMKENRIWWYGVWDKMIRSMRYDDTEYGIWWYRVWDMMIRSMGYKEEFVIQSQRINLCRVELTYSVEITCPLRKFRDLIIPERGTIIPAETGITILTEVCLGISSTSVREITRPAIFTTNWSADGPLFHKDRCYQLS